MATQDLTKKPPTYQAPNSIIETQMAARNLSVRLGHEPCGFQFVAGEKGQSLLVSSCTKCGACLFILPELPDSHPQKIRGQGVEVRCLKDSWT